VAFVFLGSLTNEPPASAGSGARQRGVRESKIKKQAPPQVAFVFLGSLTNEPPAPAGSGARQRGVREFKK